MRYMTCLLLLAVLVFPSQLVQAENVDIDYDLTSFTIASGGPCGGGIYTMLDSVGQPVATSSHGGEYLLTTGLLGAGADNSQSELYLPQILDQ